MKVLVDPEEIEVMKKIDAKYSLVASHNDIWIGNILIHNTGTDALLVDYEVVDYNFPDNDIAKLLMEPAVNKPIESSPQNELREERFPNDDEIKEFLLY